MGKSTLIIILLLPILAFSSEKNRFFVNADIGTSHHSLDASNIPGERGRGTAFSLSGGYQINSFLSAGVQYTDYGNTNLFKFSMPRYESVNFNSDGLSLAAFIGLSTGDFYSNWALGLSLAATTTEYKTSIKTNGALVKITSDSETSVVPSLNVTYEYTENIELTLQASWNSFSIDGGAISDDLGVSELDIGLNKVALGLSYYF